MTTKYPIKVGSTLYPAHTEVKPATLDEVKPIWPNINPAPSQQLAVWFPAMPHPTIVHLSQVKA